MEWVIAVVVVGGFFGVAIWSMRRDAESDRRDGVIASLDIPGGSRLRLTKTTLIDGLSGKIHPIRGLEATVEMGGTVNRRFTVTRIATLGILAAGLPKKIDDRMVYLTIEGPQTVIVHEIPVKKSPAIHATARDFAAKVNRASREAGGPEPKLVAAAPPVSPPAPSTPGSGTLQMKIRELAQLRDDGLLTDAEFEAKKAELLSRY